MARLHVKLAPLAALALFLSSGAAFAQVGTLNGGLGMATPGMFAGPSTVLPPIGSNIPLGATELGTSGLSPPIAAPMAGSPFSAPTMSTTAPTMGSAVGMYGNDMYGAIAPMGTGLSPAMPSPGPVPGLSTLAPSTQLGTGFPTTFPFGSRPGLPDTAAALR